MADVKTLTALKGFFIPAQYGPFEKTAAAPQADVGHSLQQGSAQTLAAIGRLYTKIIKPQPEPAKHPLTIVRITLQHWIHRMYRWSA